MIQTICFLNIHVRLFQVMQLFAGFIISLIISNFRNLHFYSLYLEHISLLVSNIGFQCWTEQIKSFLLQQFRDISSILFDIYNEHLKLKHISCIVCG